MGNIWIKEMTGGLDARRLPETTPGGVLIKATDGHITRGGEFEKRAAFVPEYSLPAGTVGLAHDSGGLVVFGHDTEPSGIPSGVTYQKLTNPADSGQAIDRILSHDLYDGLLYVAVLYEDGSVYHFYDGTVVDDWFDGRARAQLTVVSGDTTGPSALDELTVNGVSIITSAVSWATTAEAMATAIAAEINGTTSSPDYDATAVGPVVNIIAADAGSAANGFAVNATVSNNLVLSPSTGLAMDDGEDSAAFTPGSFVKTVRTKMYSVADELLHFSGIKKPTKWTTDTTGAGFINMATEDAGAANLTALARYQDQLAIFAEDVTIIEYIDPDPNLNTLSQILPDTGTRYPQSVTQFGDSDVFYLDSSGLRSLRARDSSNAAATTDIGVPVDALITQKFVDVTGEEYRVIGLVNPIDKRFWLIMKDEIFVFSFYENAKVSAWSSYATATTDGSMVTEFAVDYAIVYSRKPYLRSGDTIYVYGGLTSTLEYDDTQAEGWLPFLDANTPTAVKDWNGVDVALDGTWEISAATTPTQLEESEVIARAFKTSYNSGRIPMSHASSHMSLRFKSQGSGPAVFSAAVIHYEGGDDED